MKKLLARVFNGLKSRLDRIKDGVTRLNHKFDGFFDFSWTLGSLFAKLGFIVQGIFSLIFGLASLIFAILNFKTIVDLVKGTVEGSTFWLEKLEHVVGGYPSMSELVTAMDTEFTSLSTFFQPAITFTRILQITGIGDAVNSVIVCAVQGIAFVISMRLLFWSLGRVNLRMVKPIK